MTIVMNPRAVVTGAASGLGRALCLELARRGAKVLAADVNLEGAEETVRMMGGTGSSATRCDVSKRAEVEALAALADERLGGCDLVVNNAGVAVSGAVGEVSEQDWQWIVGINLLGVVNGCEVFLPKLVRQGRGHVLNVASLAGLVSSPKMAAYNATKAAVVALTETMRAELGDSDVGVSVLCPSFFKTAIIDSSRGGDGKEKKVAEKLMAMSKIDANDVARIALDGAAKGELYILPHTEGRYIWRIKRMNPARFVQMAPKMMRRLMDRFA